MNAMLLFGGWLVAMAGLWFAVMPLLNWCWTTPGTPGRAVRVGVIGCGALSVAVFANIALVRHDRQLDLTREHLYTADAQLVGVIDKLERRVQLTYFYRGDDPAGMRIRRIVEALGRRSPMLDVRTSDPDIDPSLARTAGVKLYNAALLQADGRRMLVQGTDQRELALGIQRLLGENRLTVCFMTGHGEYPSDNETFHTHVEALGGSGHDHDHGANAVVETTAHGIGRLRRSLEALGHEVVETSPATDGVIDRACHAVIDAGPRTRYSTVEVRAIDGYLADGGAALLLYDLESDISPAHAAWLRELGIVLETAVVIDEVQHYAGDPEMVAATSYPAHPVTAGLSFTFFPGVRALGLVTPGAGIERDPIVTSSKHARVMPLHQPGRHPEHDHAHMSGVAGRAQTETGTSGSDPHRVIAVAVTGTGDSRGAPFRLVVVGDSDFASNSFYPYMSNSRLALAMVRWLLREEPGAVVDARVKVRESIELTRPARRSLFAVHVLIVPGLIALVGFGIWWRRR